jgi:hypothetical protein
MLIEDGRQIIQTLHALDRKLDELHAKDRIGGKIHLILTGGAGLILRFGLKRATGDMDVLEGPGPSPMRRLSVGSLLVAMGFHVVSESIFLLHPDYEKRLQSAMSLENLEVYTLDPYDYAISKIGRGMERDLDDVIESSLLTSVDISKLKELYFDAMSYWIGDERRFRGSWDTFERRVEERLRRGAAGTGEGTRSESQ